MIIECKNCKKKFIVNDSAISAEGRTVQCSNCSTQWFQLPISSNIKINKSVVGNNISENMKASDGNTYKFLGQQWARILHSGKTGRLARKKIALELYKKTGKGKVKEQKKAINPTPNKDNSLMYSENSKGGIGIFSFLIVLIMFFASIILFLDTFKNHIIIFWPELDNYLIYIFETINNIFIIIKDLFNNYK